ncbi:MAG: YraN family protein [Actinomycetota bacterium]|nr:YraN family protein [Actinomycetota bacterium]
MAGATLPAMSLQDRAGVGTTGEDHALAEYHKRGYELLARNWRCSLGEIDLVLVRGHLIVFCEVKTRRGSSFGGPYEAVTWKKQRKLRQLAEAFLAATRLDPSAVRFDVASVTATDDGTRTVHLFESAF